MKLKNMKLLAFLFGTGISLGSVSSSSIYAASFENVLKDEETLWLDLFATPNDYKDINQDLLDGGETRLNISVFGEDSDNVTFDLTKIDQNAVTELTLTSFSQIDLAPLATWKNLSLTLASSNYENLDQLTMLTSLVIHDELNEQNKETLYDDLYSIGEENHPLQNLTIDYCELEEVPVVAQNMTLGYSTHAVVDQLTCQAEQLILRNNDQEQKQEMPDLTTVSCQELLVDGMNVKQELLPTDVERIYLTTCTLSATLEEVKEKNIVLIDTMLVDQAVYCSTNNGLTNSYVTRTSAYQKKR